MLEARDAIILGRTRSACAGINFGKTIGGHGPIGVGEGGSGEVTKKQVREEVKPQAPRVHFTDEQQGV